MILCHFPKEQNCQKKYRYQPLIDPRIVKEHLKNKYEDSRKIYEFLIKSSSVHDANEYDESQKIRNMEPKVDKKLLKEIKDRITIGEIKINGLFKYVPVRVNININEMNILLLKDGSAVYNAERIQSGKVFMVPIGTTMSIPNQDQSERLMHLVNEIDANFPDYQIKIFFSRDAPRFHHINPMDIIGVIRAQDDEKLYTYWNNFIEETYKLWQEKPGQTAGGRKTSKYLCIGKSRKKIYTVNGKKCVQDGKYKNGKIKYISVNSYKKKMSS